MLDCLTGNGLAASLATAWEVGFSSGIRPDPATSGWRLNPDAIIDRLAQPLLAAEVPLSGLHTYMSEQELNLLKLSTSGMAQPGARAPKVMRSQLLDADPSCELFDNAPYDLFCDTCAPDWTRFVYAPEYPSGADVRHRSPNIQGRFDPIWNWNGSNMTTLSNQVNNGPVILSLLKMVDTEVDEFGSAQSATQQDRQHCTVALPSDLFYVWCVQERLSLVGGEPIS
jgi:hypothetical protein